MKSARSFDVELGKYLHQPVRVSGIHYVIPGTAVRPLASIVMLGFPKLSTRPVLHVRQLKLGSLNIASLPSCSSAAEGHTFNTYKSQR